VRKRAKPSEPTLKRMRRNHGRQNRLNICQEEIERIAKEQTVEIIMSQLKLNK
jgi:hypothetical protein